MAATIDVEPEPVTTLNPTVPPHLGLVIHRCLEKDPASRYESTRDLARDLKHAASGAVSASQPAAGGSRRPALAIAAAVIVVAGAAAAWFGLRRDTPSGSPDSPLVAVRPFRNLSQDPAQAYFTEGVTDEIRGQLSKISALRVLSRSAAEGFGSADGPSIAREYGVDSLVEGSVRVERDRVRVVVELVDAASQQTRWSEQYERPLADVLTVQNEVALRIARQLAATLSAAEQQRVEKLPTTNADAYRCICGRRRSVARQPATQP